MSESGYIVWKAWRDGMIAQGREVAPERMEWDTLDQRDRDLDAAIEAEARRPALDVERLANILFRFDIGCEAHGSSTRHQTSDHREDAEAIAAEYAALDAAREDGGG